MADMCYYGNVMTTTRWWLCVTMETLWQQQDGGYVLLWQRYDNNKMADMCYYGNVILHLQQYSHRLNLLCILFKGGFWLARICGSGSPFVGWALTV